jgi:N-methylhydantoinase A/oxoprolinase/acetone carboxylase beta subunit
MPEARFRIGVDVGGTFTHAVALEAGSLSLLGKTKVLTTHQAPEGVALGVTQALSALLEESGISPSQVGFIAHSTTQATNALLEGDVAPVGILAVGQGIEGWRVRSQTRLGEIPLGGGRRLRAFHRYLDRRKIGVKASPALEELKAEGACALVVAEAFSVDDPSREQALAEMARRMGLPATGTHEISGLYGLKTRTRTAALNASLMPPMIEAAMMTESSARRSGITAPLMVMRSDGGVMNMAEVRRRPLLTILSGPAAGVAAALMFVHLSEGIFLEVGGTSTDISLITLGRPRLHSAEVGGHRLFLRTLDVRTIGLGGGSMIRLQGGAPSDVGPRSAHIAGLPYCCFSPAESLRGAKVILASPRPGDPSDYVLLESPKGERFALTLTCAANAAGILPEEDYARGNAESACLAFSALAEACSMAPDGAALAGRILGIAARKAQKVVERLLAERGMKPEGTALVGGGGGAGALVPELGRAMRVNYEICLEAEVISAIGVALALVRESVERTMPNPTPEDLLKIRKEAEEGAIRSGAAPETVSVEVEVEPLQNIVRAVGSGAAELREKDLGAGELTEDERLQIAARSLRVSKEEVILAGKAGDIYAYAANIKKPAAMGLSRSSEHALRLIDGEGVVRLQLDHGEANVCRASEAVDMLGCLLDKHTSFGDAGPILPRAFLVARGRITNLSGLLAAEQVLSLAEVEIGRLAAEEEILLVIGLQA